MSVGGWGLLDDLLRDQELGDLHAAVALVGDAPASLFGGLGVTAVTDVAALVNPTSPASTPMSARRPRRSPFFFAAMMP